MRVSRIRISPGTPLYLYNRDDDIMSKTKEDNLIGEQIGIYIILSESEEKTKDGHKKYNVKCTICKKEFCFPLSTIKRTKVCKHAIDYPDRYCLQCGRLIERKNLTPSEYKRQKFCGRSCSVTYSNKHRKKKENKRCKNCGAELNSNKKTYCNAHCQWEYQSNEYIQKWKNGEVDGTIGNGWIDASRRIRKYLFDKYDNRCSRCGWSEINPFTNTIPLEIEHIDGDATNNKEENLTLLCPNCHSLTKTYRGANKGNGTRDIKWLSRSGVTNI